MSKFIMSSLYFVVVSISLTTLWPTADADINAEKICKGDEKNDLDALYHVKEKFCYKKIYRQNVAFGKALECMSKLNYNTTSVFLTCNQTTDVDIILNKNCYKFTLKKYVDLICCELKEYQKQKSTDSKTLEDVLKDKSSCYDESLKPECVAPYDNFTLEDFKYQKNKLCLQIGSKSPMTKEKLTKIVACYEKLGYNTTSALQDCYTTTNIDEIVKVTCYGAEYGPVYQYACCELRNFDQQKKGSKTIAQIIKDKKDCFAESIK